MSAAARVRGAAAAAVSLVLAATAAAQGGQRPVSPQAPAAREQRFDVTFSVSDLRLDLRAGRYPRHASGRPGEWAPAGGVTVGVHWLRRLSTEVEFSSIFERRDVYDEEIVSTPTDTLQVLLLHHYEVTRVAPSQLLRFGVDRKVQPYLGVGVGFDSETFRDTRSEYRSGPLTDAQRLTWEQSGALVVSNDVFPTALPVTDRQHHARPFARAGIKVFIPKVVFLLVEGQVGSHAGPVRFGVGISLP